MSNLRGTCATVLSVLVILTSLFELSNGRRGCQLGPLPASPTLQQANRLIVNDKIMCRLQVPKFCLTSFSIEWFKDGVPIQFNRNGVTELSQFLGRLAKSTHQLRVSLVLPELAGNYTCRVIDDVNYPNQCSGTGQSRRPSCYAPESLATTVYSVSPDIQPSTRRLRRQFPPLSASANATAYPRLYLSRQSNANTIIAPLHSKPDKLTCRLVVMLPQGSSAATRTTIPTVRWEQKRGDYKPLPSIPTIKQRVHYTAEQPRKVECQAADLGVFRLNSRQRAAMECFVVALQLTRADRETFGDYRCVAELTPIIDGQPQQRAFMFFTVSEPIKFGPLGPVVPPAPTTPTVSHTRQSSGVLNRPQMNFNRNSSVCLGASIRMDCRVKPSLANIFIEHQPQGRLPHKHLARYDAKDMAVRIGNFSVTSIGKNEWASLAVTVANITLAEAGHYRCVVEPLDENYEREQKHESMYLTVLTDCRTGPQAAKATLTSPFYISAGVGSGLLLACIVSALLAIYYFQKRRTDPITKRLRIVCVDNSDIYRRNRRHANSGSPLLGRSSFYRQESLEGGSGGGSSLVPEVIVEVVGRGHNSGASQSGKEVRYIIPACPVLEVERKRIQMFRVLGEGAFGTVHAGQIATSSGRVQDVAVKMLKHDYTQEEMIALVKEMEIMKRMKKNPHPNIVKLVGVCTRDGPFMLLVELAHHGNMRDFLKERRISSSRVQYLNVVPGTRRVCFMPCIPPVQLLHFSREVADALDFMASKKIVHRDIAARNILVANAENRDAVVAKVADFGLTRNLDNKDYYRVITEGKLPVKWLAPECLKARIFSTQSDVWAYGVLLYEIFSLGEIPYPGVSPSNIMPHLEAGGINPQPKFAGPELYALMRDCWAWEARLRPTFSSIRNRLDCIESLYAECDAP